MHTRENTVNKAIFVSALIIAASMVGLTQTQPVSANHHKVTICHATDSAVNPYVSQSVNISAVDGAGNNDHAHHNGPVFDANIHDQQNRGWGDIIPPVDGIDSGEGVGNGKNWTTAGQAIWNNDCEPIQGGNAAPDLNWDVVCDVNTLEAVVEVSNMGNAAGDIDVNGETITVNTAETVEKRVYTGEDGIQVTLVLENQTVYDEFLTCVGGRGGNDGEVGGETTTAPTSASQKPTEAKLPKTAGDGSVAAITVGSIVALVGTAVGVARRFASNL